MHVLLWWRMQLVRWRHWQDMLNECMTSIYDSQNTSGEEDACLSHVEHICALIVWIVLNESVPLKIVNYSNFGSNCQRLQCFFLRPLIDSIIGSVIIMFTLIITYPYLAGLRQEKSLGFEFFPFRSVWNLHMRSLSIPRIFRNHFPSKSRRRRLNDTRVRLWKASAW